MPSQVAMLLLALTATAEPPRWELPTVLGVRLGVDGFAAVKRTLGGAAEQQGDVEGLARLCYVSSDPSDPTVVLFDSSIFGGHGAFVNAISVHAAPPEGLDPKTCRRTPKVSKALRSSSGLRLGMSQAEARRLLGEGVEQVSSGLSKTRTTVRDGSATFEGVTVRLEGDAVVQFAVGWVTGGGG
jgi:hypothetical protein